jgi:hypothetical protein
VQTRSYYTPNYDGTYKSSLVDETAASTIDAFKPAMWFGDTGANAANFSDQPGQLKVQRNVDDDSRVLVLHLHGEKGARSQIITPTDTDGPTPPTPTAPPTTSESGPHAAGTSGSGSRDRLAATGADYSSVWLAGFISLGAIVSGLVLIRRRRSAPQD